MEGNAVGRYLNTLVELRLVSRRLPMGASLNTRGGHWRLEDPFLRFWFRFVFPYQSDLETGLRANDLYDGEVADELADHVAPVFEDWCRGWLRSNRGSRATKIDVWWGNAANKFRKNKERSSEEIDAVGTLRNRVSLLAECKWTNRLLTPRIVGDLDDYKIPALKESGFNVVDEPKIVLFSKAGYSDSLRDLAEADQRIELVNVPLAFQEAFQEQANRP